jgi:hypothetical protein
LTSSIVVAGEYASVTKAVEALSSSATSSRWDAVQYLARRPEAAVPRLMEMVRKQENGWIYGSAALIQSKDARVVPFYIDLLRANYHAREADEARKQSICILMPHDVFGGVLARGLGELGDSRAIPILEEAAKEGDSEVRKNAYEALYKLGALSLDELFDLAKSDSDPQASISNIIQGIGWASIHSDTTQALEVFDRIIGELPKHEYDVASAHFWKVQCFTILKRYDRAIQECDEVMKFPRYENLIVQIKAQREELLRLSAEVSE